MICPPTGSDQPLCCASFPMRSAPMLCPLPTPISPSDISPTDQPLYDIPLPMPIRSSLSDFPSRPRLSAPMICPYPFRSARPHPNFVNLRWTSKHTQFNPPIFINKSLEKYKTYLPRLFQSWITLSTG